MSACERTAIIKALIELRVALELEGEGVHLLPAAIHSPTHCLQLHPEARAQYHDLRVDVMELVRVHHRRGGQQPQAVHFCSQLALGLPTTGGQRPVGQGV